MVQKANRDVSKSIWELLGQVTHLRPYDPVLLVNPARGALPVPQFQTIHILPFC